jgi:hypothetical protein
VGNGLVSIEHLGDAREYDLRRGELLGDPESAERELGELGALTTNLGAYLRLDNDWSHLDSDLARYASHGVSELHLYHLGLMSQSSAATASRIVKQWKPSVGATNTDQIGEPLNDG